MSKFKSPKIISELLDLIVFGIFIPPILLIVCILYTYKSIVGIIAHLVDPTLSPLEGNFDVLASVETLGETENVKGNIGWIISVDGKVDINWLRNKFLSAFLGNDNYANYYRYLTTFAEFGGYTFRKALPSGAIDLNFQIVESEVPENLSLNEFIRIWFNKPYKANQPLWEIMLVSNREEMNTTYLVYKMHHNLGDGYTLINVLNVLTNSKTPYIVKEFTETRLDQICSLIKSPRILFNYFMDVARITKDIPLPVTLPEDNNIPAFHTTMTFELKDFKSIQNKIGVNFQSIALSLLGGLTRRIALEKNKQIQDYTYITFSLPWPNHPTPNMANHSTIGIFKVPLKEISAEERLIEVDRNYQFVHDNEIHKILYRYFVPILCLFPAWITRKIFSTNTGQQVGVSSIMGSRENLYLNGHPIKTVHPIMGKMSTTFGLMSFCFSHSGHFNLFLIGTKDVVNSQKRMDTIIRKYVMEEFEALVTSIYDESASCVECVLGRQV